MSTVVDKVMRRARVSSADMRARVLAAAGQAFSRAGYDAVGVREIATMAGTDPAIVIRLFGSKAALFEALAEGAFGSEDVFEGPLETLGVRLATHLMLPVPPPNSEESDDFHLLLRSATSLTAAPILSAALHRALVEPLGRRIGGRDGAVRAALVTAQVLGFATLRFALGSTAIDGADRNATTDHLAGCIQFCIEH